MEISREIIGLGILVIGMSTLLVFAFRAVMAQRSVELGRLREVGADWVGRESRIWILHKGVALWWDAACGTWRQC